LKVRLIGSCFQILAAERYLNQYEEYHDCNKDGVDDPETEVADGYALVVWLQDREHQDPVSGVPNSGHQPEHRAEGHQHAVRGYSGKGIRRTENGLDEYVPSNANNEPREVHRPHDSCGRSVCIRCSVDRHRSFSSLN
jgi:hypothetical protein